MRFRLVPSLVALVLVLLALAPWGVPWALRQRADNPIWRGQRLAEANGCFNCHRAPHNLELANPGSTYGTVPSFAGGNAMMYVESPAEVVDWIRDGHTAKLAADPAAWARYQAQLVRMPAFGKRLSTHEIDDLAAFVLATDGYHGPTDERAAAGAEIAQRSCLSCHNVGGAGGLANPGSLFGYVPAFWGPDFADLVRDDDELREWIRSGSSQRVAALPLASWVTARQQIHMPAFGDALSAEDVESLVAYIRWLAASAGGTRAAP